MLLDAGAVIDAKNEDEQTPIHLAAENGRVKIVVELVGRKHEIVHDDDENANTALHLAALSGRIHVVRELVRLGASIGARNAKQWTPLDCCAFAGMHKSAIVLLEADSPVDPKDKRKITPLHLACQEGHTEMVQVLLQ
uniref:Ankyrin repeat and SOCS box protein 10-like n=1 Tax=Phallusia mammillata TaxID=59560 RepID=A0A6F9D7J5_9ASCI|nr:ankyrin repeat and SOCS box protein 10-like [Phallusia mammillata]